MKLPATLHDVEEATAYAFSYMMDQKVSHELLIGRSLLSFMCFPTMLHPVLLIGLVYVLAILISGSVV